MTKPLTDAQREQIGHHVTTGFSIKETADRFGVGRSTVRRILMKLGIKTRKRHFLSDEQREQIKANARAGLNMRDNARNVGVSDNGVRGVLKKAGLYTPVPLLVTITNAIEEYRPGQQFTIARIRFELDFGNMPSGLTMKFPAGFTAHMDGAQLHRDDGAVMMLTNGAANHRWV